MILLDCDHHPKHNNLKSVNVYKNESNLKSLIGDQKSIAYTRIRRMDGWMDGRMSGLDMTDNFNT